MWSEMNTLSYFWLALWGAFVYAQDTINAGAVENVSHSALLAQDPLLGMLLNGGITLPSALLISVWIIANKISKWTPTIQIEIKEPVRIRQLENKRS